MRKWKLRGRDCYNRANNSEEKNPTHDGRGGGRRRDEEGRSWLAKDTEFLCCVNAENEVDIVVLSLFVGAKAWIDPDLGRLKL